MPKSYRIRTQPGVDKNIKVEVSQDFDFLEILSLKLRQEDVYTRFCADYGVVVGRVITNGGYGLPNAKVSVFVPLDSVDENDPIISTLYPYKNIGQKNEDGYRYNLLPYEQTYGGHTPTGTFPTEDDILTRQEVLEVYEKYYKYTVKTNESGDFMIIGVPLGIQKIVMDLDLSDMGCFSLRPSDLIRMGLATEGQVAGQQFRASTDLETLPQIINSVKDVDVASFWGQEDLCNIGITRVDFDLRDFGVNIQPHAIFMGSIFSNPDEDSLKENCRTKNSTGRLCELTTGPGQILAIRQTIGVDNQGYPVLEEYKLENGGNVIDSEGAWLCEVPMNLDYVVTNEFGEQVLSNDPSIGIPTSAKYRFKVKWQNEGGLQNEVQRANYLVPNIKEYYGTNVDTEASYAFSLDWADYADKNTLGGISSLGEKMIEEAINCEDRFYQFHYNKVYTISSNIDRFKFGFGDKRHLGIKNIDDSLCKNSVNKFPVNDGEQNSGNLILFDVLMFIVRALFIPLIIVLHVVYLIYGIIIGLINAIKKVLRWFGVNTGESIAMATLNLPMISYPDCENCNCETTYNSPKDLTNSSQGENLSLIANVNDRGYYSNFTPENDDELNKKLRWLLSGNDAGNFQRVPVYDDGNNTGRRGYSEDPSFPHRLNLLNQRERYFKNAAFVNQNSEANIIKTTIKNSKPGTNQVQPSEPLYDNVMVLLCDPGTFDSFGAGKLVTFSDINKLSDKNVTGGTVNQFGNTSITGTSLYDNNNLINKSITNILPDGTVQTANLKILSDNSEEKYYNFPSGVEYLQIITGGTVSEFANILWSQQSKSILFNYIIRYKQTLRFRNGSLDDWDDVELNNNDFVEPLLQIPDYRDHEIILLNRGVDPYTQRQNIEYDLSILFGKTFGNVKVEGSYFLNIPIQPNDNSTIYVYDAKSPQSHLVGDNTTNNGSNLFFPSFTFTPDSSKFTAFTTTELLRYSSMDKSKGGFKVNSNDQYNVGTYTNPDGVINDSNKNYFLNQGRVEGSSLLGMYKASSNDRTPTHSQMNEARLYSPVYYNGTSSLTINNSQRLVFRSDRLPTSDQTEVYNNNSYVLHQNQKFVFYGYNDDGETIVTPNFDVESNYKGTGSKDFTGDTTAKFAQITGSLSCDGMVRLSAYEGYGTNFTIDEDKNEDVLNQKDVVNGCYRLIKIPIGSLIRDGILFTEWMARYRVMYAACNGAFAQMFQNNWVNGTLYMPSFYKGAIFNSDNEVSYYRYCGFPQGNLEGEGPIYYNQSSNNFYYKSTRYVDGTGFVAQEKYKIPILNFNPFGAVNERNMWSPTTIMDLGPRDQFTKQICFDPDFEGYLVDTLRSTSYNDTSDLLNMFILSRLANSNFLGQLTGLGDASINAMFSRTGDRIDGDVAQMWSINSEFGIVPFLGTNYTDDRIFVSQDTVFDTPIFGIFFTGDTQVRQLLTPGKTTYTEFGYPKTQEVPFYKWSYLEDDSIFTSPKPATNNVFGYEDNTWDTNIVNGKLFSSKYQTLDFNNSPYFKPTNGNKLGYIYNRDSNGNVSADYPQNQPSKFLVGAPFHFYFGLRRGKSAMNRYISKYLIES